MARDFLNGLFVRGKSPFMVTAGIPGTLFVGVGKFGLPMPRAGQLVSVRARLDPGPTGADAIFDLNLNGTTVFTTQANRPRVVAGTLLGALATPDVVNFNEGDVFTVDCDQIGSIIAGGNATLVVNYI